MDRRIILSGADNARDLGGIVNRAGCVIKRKMLIRSNALCNIDENDARVLSDGYGLRRIIDLRMAKEAIERPDAAVSGAEYMNIPVFDESKIGISREKGAGTTIDSIENVPDMGRLYAEIVSDDVSVGRLSKIIDAIVSSSGAVLWHCSEGKDRCGITAMLVLSLLDVDISVVREDYLMTNIAAVPRAQAQYQRIVDATGDIARAERVRRLFIADGAYFDAAVEAIEKQSGSVDGYIRERLGVSEEKKRAFMEKVME